MNSGSEKPPFFGGQPGEPVPEVDPEDLKGLWRLQREIEASHPGQQVATGIELVRHYCKPGANVAAVCYRSTMLWLLSQIARERFSVFTKHGQPIDAAFRAAAQVSAKWMGEGITIPPPFDVDEFLRLCREQEPPPVL